MPACIAQLVQLVAEGLPPDSADTIAEALLPVIASFPEYAAPALHDAMVRLPTLVDPDVAAGLSSDACDAIAPRMLALAATCNGSPGSEATQPFREMMAGFCAVCYGHAPVETLLSSTFGHGGEGGGGGFTRASALRR
ncbi:hypothetical protein EON68_00315 [archaeon]|nr:MAG: hypothetical protein EON68_00315 [archaeon]